MKTPLKELAERKRGTRKLARPQGGSAQALPPLELVRSPWVSKSSHGNNWAALKAATRTATAAKRRAPAVKDWFFWRRSRQRLAKAMVQVKRTTSGEPVTIWHAPISAAETKARPPSRPARSR